MTSPFPGMDPYLEHRSLWPDIHNSLISAIRDELSPQVAPNYYVGLERRAYLFKPDDIVFVGRPDVSIVQPRRQPAMPEMAALAVAEPVAVYEVDLPMAEEVSESFLEIREVKTGRLITLMELLSPVNKISDEGREQYIRKRADVLRTWTSLVEIDLLRGGKPMPMVGPDVESDYRILISPGWRRPHARLHAFSLRQPIPEITIPLQKGEDEPTLALNDVLHSLYNRARFDLRLDYTEPPVPPLSEADAEWVRQRNVKRET
ncbi:MAG: DUF4058 family protein [Caldilineaceae bacterium]|nr:DUF4058 family protein [Caldilineaceae bacterium]